MKRRVHERHLKIRGNHLIWFNEEANRACRGERERERATEREREGEREKVIAAWSVVVF